MQGGAIGAPRVTTASLSLGPASVTSVAGQPSTETATLLDGSGHGLPNATVNFAVTGGPDGGLTGSAVTDSAGHATFSLPGAGQGEDVVAASVTTVGSFSSGQSRVMWTSGSAAGWTSADIGTPALAGSQSFDSTAGTWTVAGSGTGIGGTADQFHFASQPASGGTGGAA